MKLSLVLLTYNEIEGLRALWKRIPFASVFESFAVDGGSGDGTREFFEAQGFECIVQQRSGRGEAFRIAHARSRGDALVFFSPDGNEDPADIERFRQPLEEGADLVIASRLMRGARNEEDNQVLRLRKWANQAFTLAANVAFNRGGSYVTDTINGFRAVRRDVFDRLALDGDGYTIEYQMSIRAFCGHCKIVEFPTQEGQRIGGESYARSIPTGLRFVRLFARETWLALRGR